jgi:hypothetical protein
VLNRPAAISLIAGLAAWAMPTAAMDVETVEFSAAGDLYVLTLSARLEAPIEAVFEILTDYPRLSELHDAIEESRVVGTPSADATDVFTRIRGCVAFFCRHLVRTERVTSRPPAYIEAVILPATGDFDAGLVRWDMRPLADNLTHVDYVAEIRPRFWVPPLIGKRLLSGAMRRTTGELLEAVETRAAEGR